MFCLYRYHVSPHTIAAATELSLPYFTGKSSSDSRSSASPAPSSSVGFAASPREGPAPTVGKKTAETRAAAGPVCPEAMTVCNSMTTLTTY